MPSSNFDPQIQSENIAFDPNEMIACAACGRSNPPNRLKCIYCAAELPIPAEAATRVKLALRKLEPWERGFNLVVRTRSDEPNVADAARLLSMESESVASILNARLPLPLVRTETEKEANLVRERLSGLGIDCTVFSDEQLDVDRPPVRLSGCEFSNEHCMLTDFNTSEKYEVPRGDFALIVPGVITVDRVDSRERKGRGGKTKMLDESPTMSDEMVADIYTRGDPTGYRVRLSGFDFSCLGEQKGLLAAENMRLLVGRLIDKSPNAKLVDDYRKVRPLLDPVWEIETRTDAVKMRRSGIGKIERGLSASSSNAGQFTKFSRFQWYLL